MSIRRLAVVALAIIAFPAAHAGPSESMAFAIGKCSAITDTAARLACYDTIAESLKSGVPPAPTAAPRATVAPAAPSPQQQAYTPSPAYTPPAAQPSPPYVPPPAYTPPSSPASPPYVPPTEQTYTPPPTQLANAPQPQQAYAPPHKKHAWYDVGSWFSSDDSQPAPAPAAAPSTTDTAKFGSEDLPPQPPAPGEPGPIDRITANVTSVAFDTFGKFTVTLDNGQVWRQLDSDDASARFSNGVNNVVTISRGLLGSYNLVLQGQTALFKVKRIR